MKKHFILMLFGTFLCCTTTSFAQLFMPKGSVIGGGGISFSSTTVKQTSGSSTYEDTDTKIGVNPNAMYFIIDNLGLGANLSLISQKSKAKEGDAENSYSELAFGPRARYYFAEGPFADASFGFGSRTDKSSSGGFSNEGKRGITSWELGAGYSVRVTDTILIDPMVGYGSTNAKSKENSDNTLTESGFFIRVGFTLVLVQR